jgi:hypothetical protein
VVASDSTAFRMIDRVASTPGLLDALRVAHAQAWSYVNNLSRSAGDGWVNEHFINDGALSNQFVAGEPMCGSNIPGATSSGGSGSSGGGSGSSGVGRRTRGVRVSR